MTDTENLDDQQLAVALARMWDERDPMPAGLADSVILSLAMSDLDAEAELLTLVEDHRPAETRDGATGLDEGQSMTFSNDRVTVMVAMSPRPRSLVRLDGWIDGPAGGQVSVRPEGGQPRTVGVDADGRFVVEDLERGLVRLEYRDPDGRAVAAPAFEI